MLVSALVLKIGYHNIGLAKSGSKGPSSESTIATDRLQVLGLIEKLEVVVKIGCHNIDLANWFTVKEVFTLS